MKLTVVGCSGSFPGPDSAASCYLVEAAYDGGTFRLLLDLGSGALGSLQRHAALGSIDSVVLTHLHADHCLDLCGFYVVRKYHPDGPMGRLPIYGPDGTGERLARAYGLSSAEEMDDEFDFRTLTQGPFRLGPFAVSAARVDHPGPAFAIKVSDGAGVLVYSGDTGPCPSLERFAAGADLLLAEASFLGSVDNPEHLHLTGGQAASIADKAAVGRLVLTHIPPWHDPDTVLAEAVAIFGGETTVARSGATFEVTSRSVGSAP